jgi:hypothetical protein
MKLITKNLLKLSSILFFTLYSAITIQAKTNYPNNSNSADKTITITSLSYSTQSIQKIDDCSGIETKIQIENWMFEESFWIVTDFYNWELDLEEQFKLKEDSIIEISISPNSSQNDIVNDKEWMKKHSFYIL